MNRPPQEPSPSRNATKRNRMRWARRRFMARIRVQQWRLELPLNLHSGGAFSAALLPMLALLIAAAAPLARSATFVVTTTADGGAGSLRQAITSANATAAVTDNINFNVAGSGPHTITPITPLPSVTAPVILDGYTQAGASPNTLANGNDAVLKIVLQGTLIIDTSNSVVRGLAVRDLNLGKMGSTSAGNNVVEGNFIGLDATGTNAIGGMALLAYLPNNRIGGTTPAARNVISGHPTAGGLELLENGSGNTVQGNFIGTDRTGTQALGNFDRALVCGAAVSSNLIGGTVAGARNVISGNFDRGITLDGSNNIVQGNFIGTDVTGLKPLGNARTGVEIGGPGNLVGGTNAGSANVIAFNGSNGGGVFTTNGVDVKFGATGFAVLGNSIFENAGLGIDVNADMLITAGHPVLTIVSNTGTATLVRGTHTPNRTFRLELFTNPNADPSGYGEGKTLLTATNVTTDASGNFALTWPLPLSPGLFVTATANGTSEFSQARPVRAPSGPNSWSSSTGGKWETGANWSLNVPPFSGQIVVSITNAGTKTVRNDAETVATAPGTLTLSNLVVSAPGGATNTLLLAHGGTETPLRILETVQIKRGGALTIDHAALQLEAPSITGLTVDGSVALLAGQILASSGGNQIVVGDAGSGTLTVSNGTLEAFSAMLGANPGTEGTWRIAGGTNFINTSVDLAGSLTATGSVVMTGGELSMPSVYVGLFGRGNLSVANGLFECFGQGVVASRAGARGNFIASGGVSSFFSLLIGDEPGATGTVQVAGNAIVQLAGPLDNRGAITVSGGDLRVFGPVESRAPGNSIAVTGGRLTATNDNAFLTRVAVSSGTLLARDIFLGNGELGTFTMSGGVMALPGSFNGFNVGVNGGTGVVSQAGGQILLTNTDFNLGGLFGPAVGQMTISNGITVANRFFVGGQGDGTGTLRLEGGTLIASNLEVNSSSQLIFNQGALLTRSSDVANGALFVIGDGTHPALYQLMGGTNRFARGLRIAQTGVLGGNGTITANVTNLGRIAPGASPGRLDIVGGLVLNSSSELRLEVGGSAPGSQFDLVTVSAGTALGGTLSVGLTNNFQTTMTNGTSFTVLTSGTPLTGAFANVASGGTLTTIDGHARFTVLYAGSTAVRLTNLEILDTDADGLPNWWEDLYGLNKNSAADASLDPDGDRASNLNEFRAGTAPNNAASVFRINALNREPGGVRISWTTVGGRSYRLQTNVLTSTGSLTTNFADLSPLIGAAGTGESVTNFLHPAAANATPRHYRVRLGP